jgi:hypothetical protein
MAAYDFSQVINDAIISLETSLSTAAGVYAGGNISTDGTASPISESLNNIFKSFFSGFTSTSGGQDVVAQAAASGAQSTFENIAKNPLTWVVVLLIISILWGRKK